VIAGNADGGFADGNGVDARLGPILGIARDGNSLVVGDAGNFRVRLIEPGADAASTHVRTLAGSGRLPASDGTGGEAGLVLPTGVAVDAQRRLACFSDTGSATVRCATLP
jgi:hypothetical protein